MVVTYVSNDISLGFCFVYLSGAVAPLASNYYVLGLSSEAINITSHHKKDMLESGCARRYLLTTLSKFFHIHCEILFTSAGFLAFFLL